MTTQELINLVKNKTSHIETDYSQVQKVIQEDSEDGIEDMESYERYMEDQYTIRDAYRQ